jgi:predicted  nucleic acid-binding Zn-ribbon protein
MADLEQRVATLERDMSALKERVGSNEEDLRNIPDLIKLEFRLAGSQRAKLSSDVADLQRRMGEMESKVDALPRIVAELVVEALDERESKR